MLVIIACLLALNFIKGNSEGIAAPFFETKIEANAPAFIQVGKTFNCSVAGRTSQNYEIKQIDKEHEWIEAKWIIQDSAGSATGESWFNLFHFQNCKEIKAQSVKSDK